MATISKSVTVVDGGTYTLELNAIPTGSTVTPVNDIQTWLHCADIWDKSYTTLDQVLADAPTLQALIASNNAADYMARSTDWASDSSVGLVPVMTSNTTPSGVASASIVQDANRDAYKAFDGNTGTHWRSTSGSASSQFWLDYKFPTATKVSKFYFTGDPSVEGLSQGNYTVTLQKSTNNGSSYSNIYTSGTINLKTFEYTDPNPTAATNYRILFTGGNAYHSTQKVYMALIQEAQFYSKPGIPTNQNAMTYIGNNNYCANKLLSNTTWLNAICNSVYFESVLKIKVPTMTSNTTPSGVVSANSVYQSYYAYLAFDGNEQSLWHSLDNANSWIYYQFPTAIKVYKGIFRPNGNSYGPYTKNYQIQGSNDGTNWTTLLEATASNTPSALNNFVIPTNKVGSYKYYRMQNIGPNYTGQNYMSLYTLQFYGRA